jgi:beta-glucosidase
MAKKRIMTKSRYKKIHIPILCILTALAVTANVLMLSVFRTELNTVFGTSTKSTEATVTKSESIQNSRELATEIMEGGAVLLENNGVLPLTPGKINMLGYRSADPVYGGTGSGNINTSVSSDFKKGLEKSGFSINNDVYKLYESKKKPSTSTGWAGIGAMEFSIDEVPLSEYTGNTSFDSMKKYSDTAVVVIGRVGGEGNDLPTDMNNGEKDAAGNPKHYLELSDQEEELLRTTVDNFENVIVLINSAHAMELGFLEDMNIDAALWVGAIGETGADAIGEILAGEVNPSGRLVDTYPYDALSAPSMYNYGDFQLLGVNTVPDMATGENRKDLTAHYVHYYEGIYVGYRWYETAAAEGVFDYDKVVQYPFGYGMSYTEFDQQLTDFKYNDTDITVTVSVQNTGTVAGQSVVELYYTPPYYQGGIEKSEINLIRYGKTDTLDPGDTQDITLSFPIEEMASYDYLKEKAYVLDEGDYEIKVMANSHEFLDSEFYHVPEKIIYNGAQKRSSDVEAATNLFDDSMNAMPFGYMSRENGFANRPTTKAESIDITDNMQMMSALTDIMKVRQTLSNEEAAPVMGKAGGLVLKDLTGKSYDDAQWDTLLDQMSLSDMMNLSANGGWSTAAIASVGKPATSDIDGPSGLSGFMLTLSAAGFPGTVVLAATWDPTLAYAFGQAVGDEANAWGISGWYAPGCNTHRTPFAGRNFEYYSEDGFLSGTIAAGAVAGAKEKGIYSYVKHFALNDQELNRCNMLCTFSNEQAMREVYLKPFEMAVKLGGATAMMSSFNWIGDTWSGASYPLLTELLREEWGFRGMVVTDACVGYGFMDPDQAVLAGNDLMLYFGVYVDEIQNYTQGQQALRQSAKNILYTQANSHVVTLKTSMPVWQRILYLADALIGILLLLYLWRFLKKLKHLPVEGEHS